jgi:hypothetical protein
MAVNEDIRRDPNGDADAGLTRLYGEASREQPPAHLDAAILAAARSEVGARPRPLAALRAWRVPVGIAAVVVLSVSLVTVVRKEGGDELYQAAPRDLPKPVEPAPWPSEAPAQKPPIRRALEMGPGEPPEAARPKPQPSREADMARRDAAPGAPAAVMDNRAPSARSAPAAGAAGGTAAEAREAAPPPAAAPAAKAMRQEQDATPKEDSGPAAAGKVMAPERKGGEVALPPDGQYSRQRAMGSLSGQPRLAAILKQLDSQPPEKWLETIQALRREGQGPEANEVLAEFKRRYPAHPLPAGLE